MEDLDKLHNEKSAKYNNIALHKALADKYNNEITKSLSVTFNWRGAMSLKSYKSLKLENLIKNRYVATIGYQIYWHFSFAERRSRFIPFQKGFHWGF